MEKDKLIAPKKDEFYSFAPFRVPKYKIEFKQVNKISDVPGYVWYTPASIYIWGRYSETNLSDIVQRHNIKIFWYKFDKPIFTGFNVAGDTSWNHILWAASTDLWPKFVDSIIETVQFDIPNMKLYQYAMQTLTIQDPLVLDTQRIITTNHPKQVIHSFAVLSNDCQIAFDTRNMSTKSCPHVVSFKPDLIHVNAANKLFSNKALTQDKAFEGYKEIMIQAQNENHERNLNKENKNKK